MAFLETHIEDCERLLGNPFTYVHLWLDWYAKKYPPNKFLEFHRQFRHNDYGVSVMKHEYGFYAETAAKIHIIRDTEMYVCIKKMFNAVEIEEIDDLYKISLNFCLHTPEEVFTS